MFSLVIGGARSGKSRFAQQLCRYGTRVVYLATARVEDREMAARIARHRSDRPPQWVTVEEPLAISRAIQQHAAECDFLLLDCLTVWLSNFCWEHREEGEAAIEAAAIAEVARAVDAARQTHAIAVTNEVGCGVVPESPVGRSFRDLHGFINQEAARRADWVYHVVAGIPTAIKRPEGAQ